MDEFLERIEDVHAEISAMTKGEDKSEEFRKNEKDREAKKLREI